MTKAKKKKVLWIVGLSFSLLLCFWLLWIFWFQKLYLFHQSETFLTKAAHKYFDTNLNLLPEKEGGVSTVSLEQLYEQKWLKALYVPKTETLCDTASWVKVRKENGEYQYYTYLKCEKMESNVDHDGPEITLNGEEIIKVDRGKTYQDAGVKKVLDQNDGEMELNTVKVSGEVDTSKIGTYTITYTAYDKLHNKTVKKRTVSVVDMLSTVVKSKTGDLGYYQGADPENYVLFSGMLFQIIGVESDHTTKLISAYPVGNMNYQSSDATFMNSDMKKWLNDYFYNHLGKTSKTYLVASPWCEEVLTKENLGKQTCEKQSEKLPVGLLSIPEFNRSLVNETESYLQSPYMYWLVNRKDESAAWVNRNDFYMSDQTNFLSFTSNTLLGVRPVIRLKQDTPIVSGRGTLEDPYKLDDYTYGEPQTSLNKRLPGEYLTYSGYLFRIMEVEEDQTIKVIMAHTLKDKNEEILIKYDTKDKAKVYNPKQAGNIGYQIENQLNRYLNTKLFVSKEIKVPVYDERAIYEAKRFDKYKVKLSAPDAYEIFSAKNDYNFDSYWYRNSSKTENVKYVMANAGSIYTLDLHDETVAGVKVVGYLNKDVKITSGKGLIGDPYYIR